MYRTAKEGNEYFDAIRYPPPKNVNNCSTQPRVIYIAYVPMFRQITQGKYQSMACLEERDRIPVQASEFIRYGQRVEL